MWPQNSQSEQLRPANLTRDDTAGYRLWVGYFPPDARLLDIYRSSISAIVCAETSPMLAAARRELTAGLGALLDREVPSLEVIDRSGAVVVGTPASSPAIAQKYGRELAPLGTEGFLIRSD